MNGRRRVFVILGVTLVLGLGLGVWKWVNREKPSYESVFVERIWIDYPAGNMLETANFGGDRMNSILRERKAGYLAGVTSRVILPKWWKWNWQLIWMPGQPRS